MKKLEEYIAELEKEYQQNKTDHHFPEYNIAHSSPFQVFKYGEEDRDIAERINDKKEDKG